MGKTKEFIKTNILKLIIIVMLAFSIFQQTRILKEVKRCQNWYELEEIQNGIDDIKNRLGI